MTDNIFVGTEARDRVIKGFSKVADAVKITLGAAGSNGIIEDQLPPFNQITNDGVSVARSIELVDPVERMGANLAKEIANRTDKQSNDGTTTALTLAEAILEQGVKVDCSPMQLKRELEECLPLIEAALDAQKKEITVNEVGTVATISAEDPTIGAMIQEIYQQIGKDGILFRDFSKTFKDYYTIGQGIKISDAGFVSPYMADLADDGRPLNAASFKNPKILITKQKISSGRELDDFFLRVYKAEVRELVIFADDFDPLVIPYLVSTRIKTGFKTVLVKMPVLWKDWWFEDLAVMTGASIVDGVGLTLKKLQPSHLGTVENIIIDKHDTFIEGIADITQHIASLSATEGKSDEEIENGKIRVARMNQKTARYFVGAPTDQALSYRAKKVEDACGAAYQALQNGIVAGGGVALLHVSINSLPDTAGAAVLKKSLRFPFEQILKNAGLRIEDMEVKHGTAAALVPTFARGCDVRTGEMVNMFGVGIIDPLNVVKNSVRNAISVAAQILTVRSVTHLPRPEFVHTMNYTMNQQASL